MPAKIKIAIFDVEGVLLPKNRYLTFEMGRSLGFLQFLRLLFTGALYEARLLSLESAMKRIYYLFHGFTTKELLDIFTKLPLLPYTDEVFTKLKEKGIKTVLISSGLPQVIVEELATRLKTDYAIGLELETNNDVLTGNIKGEVIKKDGKALVMEKVLHLEGLMRKDCVVVADDHNNAPIFYPQALKIGYNPDFLIAFKSDYVIKENLLEILPILEEARRPRGSLTRSEAIREVIHASGLLVTLAAVHFGNYTLALILFLTALVYVASELARIEKKEIPIISSITLEAATSSERYEFTTAPAFFALGIMLSLLMFPTPINYASIAILSLGDSAASIFGKLFGKTPIPFNKGKNLEGSLAGFAFAFLGASIFLSPMQAFVGALIGMLVESLPLPVNDNLSTPLVTGALLVLIA